LLIYDIYSPTTDIEAFEGSQAQKFFLNRLTKANKQDFYNDP